MFSNEFMKFLLSYGAKEPPKKQVNYYFINATKKEPPQRLLKVKLPVRQ